jgi:hypothetical protein
MPLYLDVFVIFLIISQFLTLIYMSLQLIFIMQKIILPHPIPMHTQFFLHFKFVLKLSYAIYWGAAGKRGSITFCIINMNWNDRNMNFNICQSIRNIKIHIPKISLLSMLRLRNNTIGGGHKKISTAKCSLLIISV